MNERKKRPAGFWPSWVSSAQVAGSSIRISEVRGFEDTAYWLEMRPQQSGRTALVACRQGQSPIDLLPNDFDVGNRVNEYGGGSYAVAADGRIVFSRKQDASVWMLSHGRLETFVHNPYYRFADFAFDPSGDGVYAVREDHSGSGEVRTGLVYLTGNQTVHVLEKSHDFYAAPRPSPDGKFLAWISWDHPNMPWDETILNIAQTNGAKNLLHSVENLSKDLPPNSVIEIIWKDPKTFFANSDLHGCWRPYKWEKEAEKWVLHTVADPKAEIGFAPWVFGQSSLQFDASRSLLALGYKEGKTSTYRLRGSRWVECDFGFPTSVPQPVGSAYVWLDQPPNAAPCVRQGVSFVKSKVLKQAFDLSRQSQEADSCSVPVSYILPSHRGGGIECLFYPSKNASHKLQPDEKPPLIVSIHSGPTARAEAVFSWKTQWWTSRGFALLDINYRGSTGYGRNFRQALNGLWGIADVEDCLSATGEICKRGLVNPQLCFVRGSSAGGLTALLTLAKSTMFAAGTSTYGVTDLTLLAQETHKFESHYLETLVGPYPEMAQTYKERSPVHWADHIKAPVLFLHGACDHVVPLTHARAFNEILRAGGVKTHFEVFEEEGHGFRRAETIKKCLELELAFYREQCREISKTIDDAEGR